MVVRKIIESVLVAGSTTVTFTDSEIPNSLIRLYSTDEDLLPESQSVTGTTLTVTYPMQTTNKPVALEIVKAGLSIFDNLTSDDTDAALSAKQGKVLKGLIDDIVVPTVNDGTLTIQKNGSDVQTFTANSATDKTANITVPTALSDLTDDTTHRLVTDTDISLWDNVQNLYQYALVDKVAQVNTNIEGSVPAIAVRNYAAGEYFIQQKKLLRALTAISQGDTLTQDTNYEEVTVTDDLYSKDITNDLTWNTTNLSFTHKSAIRYGNLVTINVRFTVLSTVANTPIITDIPSELMPLNSWYFGQVFEQWNGSNVGNVIFNLGGHNNLYAPESSGYTVNKTYTASFTYICKGV